MKAVILVGGEATRLRPLTCNTPKMVVPVLNRPFFEHLLAYLKKHKIVDIILAVGKSSVQIQDYFGDGSKLGVRLTYSIEDFPLGTAGAVKNAERFLDYAFLVLNGDVDVHCRVTDPVCRYGHIEIINRPPSTSVDKRLKPVFLPERIGIASQTYTETPVKERRGETN